MTTEQQIEHLIKSYRFTVVMQAAVIFLCFLALIVTMIVYVPRALVTALDEYYASTVIEPELTN